MLEAGNGIVDHYNAVTGAEVKVYFDAGIPYFWGGQDRSLVFAKYPKMVTRKAFSSSDYYKKGRRYFSGLDCTGFIIAVYEGAGLTAPTSVTNLISSKLCGNHVFCSDRKAMPDDWTAVARQLTPGDILIIKHPDAHVMMFIGTLRDYGYTAQDCAALADYLDYPLMIHCSNAPGYYDRYKQLISESKDNYIRTATYPPDGGVSIAILGVPQETAEYQGQQQDAYLYWDVLEPDTAPCMVRLYDLSQATAYAFYHRDAN